jgi:hypothetical protein
MQIRSLVVLACCTAGLHAQSLTVPNQVVERDETGIPDPFPGTYGKFRQQIILGASWLNPLQGRLITGLSFKRDGFITSAMPSGQARIVVRVSSLANAPQRASTMFDANHGSVVDTPYSGTLTFPGSPALAHRDAANWSAAHAFRIDFQPAVLYRGGALCIEIEGEPVAGAAAARWRIDYRGLPTAGTALRFGTGCGPVRGISNHLTFVQTRDLHPGSAPRLLALGEPNSTSLMFVATQLLPQPLPLAFLGAPGCTLDVTPVLTIPVGMTSGQPARVHTTLPFPHDAVFASAQIFLQWAHFAPPRLTTTEALGLVLASAPPDLDAAVVTSARADGAALPSSGFVHSAKMPVLRLHW